MRRVSKTNSRPWENKSLHEEYRQANPYDEIARYFPEWDRGETRIPGASAMIVSALWTPRTQLHHLAWGHGGNRRWDRVWNLVSVGDATHLFLHANPVDMLALCLHAKIQKGDWDAAEARATLGLNLIGYLYGKSCNFDFAEEIRRNLIDGEESSHRSIA